MFSKIVAINVNACGINFYYFVIMFATLLLVVTSPEREFTSGPLIKSFYMYFNNTL